MRRHALRTLGTTGDPGAPSVAKLLWGGWHQRLGELAVAVAGEAGGGRTGAVDGGPAVRDRPRAAPVPLQPGRHHLRRL